ncbi:MAG: protein kinase [Myxococcales bacterium]|nr:protein kinase [Myxococcales bacterium]
MSEVTPSSVTIASLASLPPSREILGRERGAPSATRDDPRGAHETAELAVRPFRVGRYAVEELVGAGGMGVVYRARDPELDRAVAIKLVRPRAGARDETRFQARLLREGKAMARLSHPNVVAIHDVGFVDEVVFVAMEFVDGPSLRAWLRARARPWREVLSMFLEASRGLSAAHDAGLIHRDFKPSNVLIGGDGRPRIADFGLVGIDDAGLESNAAARGATRRAGELDAGRLTRDGAIMGTPVYMSPEQHRGEPVDERSDQFSLCVALWEALYDVHPFAADTVSALVEQVARGSSPPRGGSTRIPRWLRAALTRGLSRAPADRWPSIAALHQHLHRRLARRRRVAMGVGFGAVVGLAALAAARLSGTASAATPCEGIEQLLAWSDARAQTIERAVAAGGTMSPEEFARLVHPALNRYAQAWSASYVASCRAHAVGGLSDTSYAGRVQCLEERRAALETVAELLEEARPEVIARAASLAEQLPELAPCADERALAGRGDAPADPETAARVQALRVRLAELRPRLLISDGAYVDRALRDMSEEVARLDDPLLSIEYERQRSAVLETSGAHDAARESLQRALDLALSGDHDKAAAQAATGLVWTPGRSTPEESTAYAKIAETMIQKAGDAHESALLLAMNELSAAEERGAIEHARRQAAFARALAADDVRATIRVIAISRLVKSALVAGEQQDARAWVNEGLALAKDKLGDVHPALVALNDSAAVLHNIVGEFEAARRNAREGLRIIDALGERTPLLIHLLRNHAIALEGLGEFEAALGELERASRALAELRAPNSSTVAIAVANSRAVILDRLGRYAEARAQLEPLAQREFPVGARSMLETARLTLADIELHDGHTARARELFLEAGRWWDEHAGPRNPMSLYAANGVGLAALARGDHDAAIAALERVLSMRTPENSGPAELAQTKLALGQALWPRARARARARALVEESAALYEGLGDGYRAELDGARRWLADHTR